jgi:hypothetical protein
VQNGDAGTCRIANVYQPGVFVGESDEFLHK